MNERTTTQPQKGTALPFTPAPTGLLQHKCACGGSPGLTDECAECSNKGLTAQRRASHQTQPTTVPPIVHEVLRSSGQPLDTATRAFMEPRFGHDFSHVRVHTDARAAESARAVNALAYTVGRDVVFSAGRYAPGTPEGRRLLAHELTHTVQQGGPIHGNAEIGSPCDAYEWEADLISEKVAAAGPRQRPVHTNTRPLNFTGLTGQASGGRLQRWSYGSGAAPHADYVEVPKPEKPGIEQAMTIVTKVVNNPKDYPACPKFFKDNCTGGKDETLTNVFNAALLWKDTDPSPKLLASSVDPHHIAYSKVSYTVGRWAVAASMVHELLHNCGQASHDLGDDAKAACGKLPNI